MALQTQVQDLLTGNDWLTSQREAWEKTAAERGKIIGELNLHLHMTTESLAEKIKVLENIKAHRGMRFVNALSNPKLF